MFLTDLIIRISYCLPHGSQCRRLTPASYSLRWRSHGRLSQTRSDDYKLKFAFSSLPTHLAYRKILQTMDAGQVDTAVKAEYQYEPLPDAGTHIRLLKIVKAAEHEMVECEVEVWHRDEAPNYVGISYTWGDPDSTTLIKINNRNTRVRTNCDYVLRQAFNFNPNKYYWVDAVVVNQSNHAEKGKQVSMMVHTDG